MYIDDWIKERERRERVYREAQQASVKPRAGETYNAALFRTVRAIDRAYLAWCETDGWAVEYDKEVKP
jgi:hypothetical protein